MQSIHGGPVHDSGMDAHVQTSLTLEEMSHTNLSSTEKAVRYNGKWFKITPKNYEPERQTSEIAWRMILKGEDSKTAYRNWYAEEQKKANIFYPSFGKNGS